MKYRYHTSIIILNWNGIKETRMCIKSLLNVKEANYNIIVVDNGSKLNEAKMLESEFPGLIDIISLKNNKGFTGGVNEGLKWAQHTYQSEYFLLLNNDTEVEPLFLKNLLSKAIEKNVGLANPLIFEYNERNKISYGGGKINWLFAKPYHVKNFDERNYETYQQYLTGCCLLIKKQVIDKIGPLDERFFAYLEDVAYSLKAQNAGFDCILVPSAHIYHIEASTSGRKSNLKTYLMARNRILFVNNYTSFVYKIYFFIFNLLKLFIVGTYFLVSNQKYRYYAYLKGFIDGNLGKGGIPKGNSLWIK